MAVPASLPNYARVRLLTDRFSNDGIAAHSLGYIIEVWNEDAYEVDFSTTKGITIAQVVVRRHELELVPE